MRTLAWKLHGVVTGVEQHVVSLVGVGVGSEARDMEDGGVVSLLGQRSDIKCRAEIVIISRGLGPGHHQV